MYSDNFCFCQEKVAWEKVGLLWRYLLATSFYAAPRAFLVMAGLDLDEPGHDVS
jgi:hypothetical protein